jgi:hypothetical protein
MKKVVDMFGSDNVSVWLWDNIRTISVGEYSQGDFQDGYVVNSTQNAVTHVKVSYPKFKTKYGTYISLKFGIWNNTTNIYNSDKLKIINVPVLKSHSGYGLTACIKHYMGVPSQTLTGTHSVIGDGALATIMVEVRSPILNILDAIWINPIPMGNSGCGPATSYSDSSFTNVICASTDPVALDYWTSKHVMIPATIQRGYSGYSSLDPDTPSAVFHQYLENSMNELKKAGFNVTMSEAEMNIYVLTESQSKVVGDVNSDNIVDIYDALLLAAAFQSTPTSANWNANADLNADNLVDIYDAITLAGHFGQHYPGYHSFLKTK